METSAISVTELSKPIENDTFWKRHLKLQHASGLTRSKYCHLNNLNYARFGYWLKKWTRQSSPLVAVKLKPVDEPASQKILCTLDLCNGRILKIHDLQALSFLLEKMN